MDHCGFHAGFASGLVGLGLDHGWSGMDTIDFIGGTFGKDADGDFLFPESDISELKNADASKQDVFGVRATHGAVDVVQLFLHCAEHKGLVKVPAILVGGLAIDSTVDGFLPPHAFTSTNGYLPPATIEGAGKRTRVFRNFYKIGRTKWGSRSKETTHDSTVDSHLDVSCMTWSDSEVGDFRCQFLIRVVSNSPVELSKRSWIINPTSNLAHRKVAKEAVCTVAELLLDVYKPSKKSIEARNAKGR